MFRAASLPRIFSIVAIISLFFITSTALADESFGVDASVWDSGVPATETQIPVGGSGQLNGAFILDTVDLGDSAIQIGIRAQERFVGPSLDRVGNVFFAPSGNSSGLALWNYDFHFDFGSTNAETTVGESLEETLGKTLTPLNMRDFTVKFFLDIDPTLATDYVETDLNMDADPDSDIRLLQQSWNVIFELLGGGPMVFDPDADGIYDFRMEIRDPNSDELIARTGMTVVTSSSPMVQSTADLAMSVTESVNEVVLDGADEDLHLGVVLQNLGDLDATNVSASIALTLPAGVTVVGTPGATQGVLTDNMDGTYSWDVGTLLSSSGAASVIVQLNVASDATLGPNIIGITAEVTSQDELDSNLFNQADSGLTSITQLIFTDGFESGDTSVWSSTEP